MSILSLIQKELSNRNNVVSGGAVFSGNRYGRSAPCGTVVSQGNSRSARAGRHSGGDLHAVTISGCAGHGKLDRFSGVVHGSGRINSNIIALDSSGDNGLRRRHGFLDHDGGHVAVGHLEPHAVGLILGDAADAGGGDGAFGVDVEHLAILAVAVIRAVQADSVVGSLVGAGAAEHAAVGGQLHNAVLIGSHGGVQRIARDLVGRVDRGDLTVDDGVVGVEGALLGVVGSAGGAGALDEHNVLGGGLHAGGCGGRVNVHHGGGGAALHIGVDLRSSAAGRDGGHVRNAGVAGVHGVAVAALGGDQEDGLAVGLHDGADSRWWSCPSWSASRPSQCREPFRGPSGHTCPCW